MSSKPKLKKSVNNGGGFISFSDVVAASNQATADSSFSSKKSAHGVLAPVYVGSDQDLSVVAKKLLKKDVVTKQKALIELSVIMSDRGSTVISEWLPYFVYVYFRLAMDNDWKVRELLYKNLQAHFSIDKQLFTPYMKQIIGPWWVATADPFSEVKDEAQRAFEIAIPFKKRDSVLLYLSSSILKTIRGNLDSRPETLSDMSTTTQVGTHYTPVTLLH